jgi:peptidoglycan/xylan/chitin deacetylase (PgdA/CDA1 family)
MVPPRLKMVRYRLGRRREIAGRCLDTLAALVGAGGELIRSADGARPAVALTFDDGPSSLNTPVLLDLLAEHGARATFFVVAERIRGCEAVVERIVGQGHELANHTYSHPHTVYLSKAELKSEIERANAAIAALAPPARYIRPPFGKDRRRIASIAAKLGLQVVLWSIDSGDASGSSTAEIVSTITGGARPGAIVLLHDGGDLRPGTLDACREIVPALRTAGLELVTLGELLRNETRAA